MCSFAIGASGQQAPSDHALGGGPVAVGCLCLERAALGRLLAVKPSLLILDEPFSAQDVESQLNLVKLFKQLNKDFNLTMICISHDFKILRNLADRIIILKDGEIVESGETKEVFNNPKEDYTKFLLSAEALNLTYEEIQISSKQ